MMSLSKSFFGLTAYMQNDAVGKASTNMLEPIVLPLLTIQQYALKKVREMQLNG